VLFVLPFIGVGWLQRQGANVLVIQGQFVAGSAIDVGQLRQGVWFGLADDNTAVVPNESTLCQGDGTTVTGTHYQGVQRVGGICQLLSNRTVLPFRHRLGDQQDATLARCALIQQVDRLADRQIGAVALGRHDGGGQHTEHGFNGAGIAGEWRYRVGVAGIDYQGSQTAFALVEDVADLALGQGQPVRFYVGGQHRQRQIQQNDQAVLGLFQGCGRLSPAWPGEGDRQQNQRQTQGQQG